MSCQYVVSVESGFTVSLNFSDEFHIESVDTEEGPKCLFHWLEVIHAALRAFNTVNKGKCL